MSKLEELQNYRIITAEEIPEVNGKGYVLEHIKTKARVLVIENDDTNKVFTIGFRTPPNDDSGIPHILEHSVLCGSKKYPAKDPFVELAKGSLNTFLNAMTYSDKTVYPVASCNEKDFDNLMKVYLDAVFYPNIYTNHKIMCQEGWHYELQNPEDELVYNGVVYNEMKGVYSSADQFLYRIIESELFSDTPYGCDSGGDPDCITTLTQEKFEDFHRTYYHPSNSYIYLYGDGDMAEKLKYIDEEYLSKYDYKKVESEIKLQEPFDTVKDVTEYYPIADNESEENNTFLSYSMVIGQSVDKKLSLSMQILEYAIMDAPGAPLKEALVDAGIGDDIFSSFDNGIRQTSYSIIAKNANQADKDRFIKIIKDTLTDLAGRGNEKASISKRSLEAAINSFEFKHKEGNFGRYPKGLMLGLDAFNSWLYDDSQALSFFRLNEVFDELKKELNTSYFEDLIWEKLVCNHFGVAVTLVPKKGLAREKDDALRKKLADYKASLNENEIKKIINETKALKAYQEEPTPAADMAKLPLLNISDIEKKAKKLSNTEDIICGIPVISHKIFTNGIGYLDFLFHMNDMEQELIPYASLLSAVLKYVDTEKHSYGELSNEINFNTGGVGFTTGVLTREDENDCIVYFSAKTKAVYDKLGIAVDLLQEVLMDSKLTDKKRLKEIIAEEKAGLKTDMSASGHITTSIRATSYFSKSMAYRDLMEGVGYYEFLTGIDVNSEQSMDELVEKLQKTLKKILRKEALTVSYTGDNDYSSLMQDKLAKFKEQLSDEPVSKDSGKLVLSIKNEGFKTASQVQYVAAAGNYKQAGFSYTGALDVLQVIFSYGYLWENVRVKGGAYGVMCSFRRAGAGYFTSYRDPNLMETYDVYRHAYEYVENFDADYRTMTKYLIGTIAKLDAPMSPSAEGAFDFACYLTGLTDEKQQQHRDEVLATDVNTIKALAPLIKAVTDSGIICAIGGEEKIDAAAENFKNILSIF